jgi:hypothetical protein
MCIETKILNKIFAKQIQQFIKKVIHYDWIGFILLIQGWFNTHKSINIIQYINRINDKNHINILMVEQALTKFNITC